MNIKLKDCPFCGGPSSIYVHEGAVMKIGCRSCDLSFSKCYAPNGEPVPAEEFYKVRDELIEKWNNRSASINSDVDINALSAKFALHLKNMDLHSWIESKAISADTIYDVSQDLITIQTSVGTIRMNRDWFVTQCKRCTELHKESKVSEWLPTTEGYMCHNCNTESRYAHRTCPNCGQRMKNGMEEV